MKTEIRLPHSVRLLVAVAVASCGSPALTNPVCGQQLQRAELLVPGTGRLVPDVGDDFEDPDWAWDFRLQMMRSD